MAFGDLLELVGSTGRFQVLHVTLLCIPVLIIPGHNLLQNFVAIVPPHYCNAHTNVSQTQLSLEEKLLITVPLDESGKLQRCQRYVVPQWHLLDKNGISGVGEQGDIEDTDVDLQGCLDGWSFNMTERTSTIISDWNLVCDQRFLKEMGQTVYMGGVLVGAVLFGCLGDKYGRRSVILISYLLIAVSGTCAGFASSFSLFCVFRFGCGMAVSGILMNCSTFLLEWVPIHGRTVIGTIASYIYTMGQLILVVLGYFIRDWRWLTMAISLPFYICFLYAWWFHESSRWLVLTNNPEKAIKNLKSVAKYNGRREEGGKIDIKMVQELMKKEMSSVQRSYSFLDLFRTQIMRNITICLSAVWFSTSFAYYGLAMDLQGFGVDIYLIQVIFSAVDVPAKILATVSMSFWGRRPSQSGILILAGVCILFNLLVPYDKQIGRTCLAVIGKGLLAASFNCCYLYSAELFPTVIRQNGLGFMHMSARGGAMVAPMVLLSRDYLPWLPGLIYGGAPILSGIAALFLPETLGSPLPETIEDVGNKESGKKSKKSQKEAVILQDIQSSLLKQTA